MTSELINFRKPSDPANLTLTAFQYRVPEWQKATFGNQAKPEDIADKMHEEFEELLDVIHEGVEYDGTRVEEVNYAEAAEEMADVFIMLLQLADSLNVDLARAAEAKMTINMGRTWNVNSKGIAQHQE